MEEADAVDWAEVCERFPIVRERNYLNAAAVGAMPQVAVDAVHEYARSVALRADTAFQGWLNLKESCRVNLGALLGVPPRSLGFCSHTSHGMGLLALALEEAPELGGIKKHVVHAADEFPASTVPWQHRGYELTAAAAVEGVHQPEAFAALTRKDTLAWVVSHAQFGSGSRIDLQAFCQAATAAGVLLIINATQSAGTGPINAGELGVDALVTTGHKWLCSGFGNGVLYVKPSLWEQLRAPLAGWASCVDAAKLDFSKPSPLRDDVAVIESGSHQLAELAALEKTTEMLLELGLDNVRARLVELGELLLDGLEAKGYALLTPSAREHHSSAVTFMHPQPGLLVEELAKQKIDVVARAGGVRVSPHIYNDLDAIDAFLDAF